MKPKTLKMKNLIITGLISITNPLWADVPVNLKWDPALTTNKGKLEIEIFSDPEYKNLVAKDTPNNSGEFHWIAPGEAAYHWRVRNSEDPKVDDLVNGSFISIEASQEMGSLKVMWEPIKGAQEYTASRRSLGPIDTIKTDKTSLIFRRGEIPFIVEISPTVITEAINSVKTYNYGLRGEGFLPPQKIKVPSELAGKTVTTTSIYEVGPMLSSVYISAGGIGVDETISARDKSGDINNRSLQPGAYAQASGLLGRWVVFDVNTFYYQSFHQIDLNSKASVSNSTLLVEEDRISAHAMLGLNLLGAMSTKAHQIHIGPAYQYRVLPTIPLNFDGIEDGEISYSSYDVSLVGGQLAYVFQNHIIRTAINPFYLVSEKNKARSIGGDLTTDWTVTDEFSIRIGASYKFFETSVCANLASACQDEDGVTNLTETTGYLGASYKL